MQKLEQKYNEVFDRYTGAMVAELLEITKDWIEKLPTPETTDQAWSTHNMLNTRIMQVQNMIDMRISPSLLRPLKVQLQKILNCWSELLHEELK